MPYEQADDEGANEANDRRPVALVELEQVERESETEVAKAEDHVRVEEKDIHFNSNKEHTNLRGA